MGQDFEKVIENGMLVVTNGEDTMEGPSVLKIKLPDVQRSHFRIRYKDGAWYIEVQHKLFLNHRRFDPAPGKPIVAPLPNKSAIAVGEDLIIKFNHTEAPQA